MRALQIAATTIWVRESWHIWVHHLQMRVSSFKMNEIYNMEKTAVFQISTYVAITELYIN